MTSMIFIHYARRSATGTQVLSGSISEGWLKRERGREDRESERASTLSTSVVECLPLSRLLAAAAATVKMEQVCQVPLTAFASRRAGRAALMASNLYNRKIYDRLDFFP